MPRCNLKGPLDASFFIGPKYVSMMGTYKKNNHLERARLAVGSVQLVQHATYGGFMSRTILLAMIFIGLTSSVAIAEEESNARDMARKDLEKAMTKIRTDDAAAVQKCRSLDGPAAEACLVQGRGKRLRAEQEAMARPERIAQVQPLPEQQADAASKNAIGVAKNEKRRTAEETDSKSKQANEECKKLNGEALKACGTDVSRRRDEARALADAMYKKARSDAKGMKAP